MRKHASRTQVPHSASRSLWRPSRLVAFVGVSAALIAGPQAETLAADHNDPIRVQATGTTTGDPAADIADIFAWYTGPTGAPKSVVLALTWRADPLYENAFDPSVRYRIYIDNDGDSPAALVVDYTISIWFGKKKGQDNAWGVYVEGIPGLTDPVIGDVGTRLSKDGVQIMAGLADDPFFFDLDGFFSGLSVALGNQAGNPAFPAAKRNAVQAFDPTKVARPFGFVNTNDGFGKTNIHFVMVEVPADRVLRKNLVTSGYRDLHVWATTEGKKGRPSSGRKVAP